MKFAAFLSLFLLTTTPVFAAEPACQNPQTIATVDGMVCDFCAQGLKQLFGKEPGVKNTEIDLTAKTVSLSLAPGASISEEKIKSVVDYSGYKLQGIKRSCAD